MTELYLEAGKRVLMLTPRGNILAWKGRKRTNIKFIPHTLRGTEITKIIYDDIEK